MKGIIVIVLLAVLSAPMNTALADAAQRQRPANVVLFLVDDLGWRDLGCYGSAFHETPHVDGFARQSVRFTHAYAACHVCSPTRASIMTGKYPARLGLTDWLPGRKDYPFQRLLNAPSRQQLPVEETTLAEALKARGYATGCFGKWHLGEEPAGPLQHGGGTLHAVGCCEVRQVKEERAAEQHDLSADQPEQVEELRRMLRRWREQVSAATTQPNPQWRPE